jgi:hypothetical protein
MFPAAHRLQPPFAAAVCSSLFAAAVCSRLQQSFSSIPLARLVGMVRRLRWSELRSGLLYTAAVAAVAGGILTFGRVGQLRGRKFTMYVTSDAARGLIRGSEVWLDGQVIGTVTGVAFQPAITSPKDRLVIAIRVIDEARPHIRRNTKVQVRAGTSLIGDQVVYLSSGTPDQLEIGPGDTLHAIEQTEFESLTSEAALASKEFPGIIENVKLLDMQLRSTEGTLGALGASPSPPSLGPVAARTERLIKSIETSNGTIGLAIHGSAEWRAAAVEALASFDSIQRLVTSNQHSLGRFRRDSSLSRSVSDARRELARLQELASSPQGAVGRWRTDSAIVMSLERGRIALDSLMQDMKRHPLRYIAF